MSARSLAWILIAVAVGQACGRILSAHLVLEPNLHRQAHEERSKGRTWPTERPLPSPTFSSNDRSRWATIRALVDDGTYVVGKRDMTTLYATIGLHLAASDSLQAATSYPTGYYLRTRVDEGTGNNTGIIFEDGWGSVDKVLNPSTMEFFSSKPPFLSTLLAGLYWLLKLLSGGTWNLSGEPEAVVRTTLILVNGLTFLLYLHVLARIGMRYARTDWSRLVVLAAAGFGTMVTPFLITLQNHTLATFFVLWALAHALALWERRCDGLSLPWYHFVLAGLFAAFAVANELPALAFWAGLLGLFFLWAPLRALIFYVPPALVLAGAFFYTNHQAVGQLAPAYSEFGSAWYEYEGSHWKKPEPGEVRSGIDWAFQRETKAEYAFHLLIGHHGFLSLTPLWLVALAGLVWLGLRRKRAHATAADAETTRDLPWWPPLLTLAMTAVLLAFYIRHPSGNYGGWTNGPRWLMWLSPLLLVCLYPILDRLACNRVGRWIVYVCLAFSVLSVTYRPWNPWRHPWIYDWMVWMGWPGY